MLNYLKTSTFFIVVLFLLTSCGGFKVPNKSARDQPVNAEDRIQKNIKEGRGLRLSTSMTNNNTGGGAFVFASSNVLWRATLEKLDFMPLANVDYAGGVIITEWYGNIESNDEIKIAVRFLTSEVRSDALDVTIFKRECIDVNKCQTSKIKNSTNNEIKESILRRAAALAKQAESKKDD